MQPSYTMHTHRRHTANTNQSLIGIHMFDTACTMIIIKNSKMKMRKQGEDLKVWYTHCLAHQSPGAQNTYYLAYPVVSQEVITCNNTSVAQQLDINPSHPTPPVSISTRISHDVPARTWPHPGQPLWSVLCQPPTRRGWRTLLHACPRHSCTTPAHRLHAHAC